MTDHYREQREADEIWENAPDKASCYGGGHYWMYCFNYKQWLFWNGVRWETNWIGALPMDCADYSIRPQTNTKPHQNEPVPLKPQNPYQRTIIGLDGSKCVVDVYRVLDTFEVDSHAIAHAIKKLLAPGKRHAKTREQDLKEAIKSIEAELLLMSQR